MKKVNSFHWKRFEQAPIVGILRGWSPELILQIAGVYESAGLSTLEVTMNTPAASEIISLLTKEFPMLNIGAGTVCTPAELETAVRAGAQFIVTPILDETVIRNCVEQNIPVFPGAFSPTEIYRAWTAGAGAVKVFPATGLGPQFLKDLAGPLPRIKLLPTGGINAENIGTFFAAGAFGVGMGSSLFDRQLIQEGDLAALKEHFLHVSNSISV
jgi:2-dehydro-3-deoxyphosphogluconate aldolase/(4S)-4-hydroxy-2-oxoglutarate aldolase